MKFEECLERKLIRPHDFNRETVRKEIENARRHLENARKNYEFDIMEIAIVSSYTSMFHAARALLFHNGYKERSHVCLVAFLKEKYPSLKEYHDIIDIYRKNRHESLYGIDYRPREDDAKTGMEYAKNFIETVKDIIDTDEKLEDELEE